MIHDNTVSMSGTLKTALKKKVKKTDTPLGEDNH